MALRGQRFVILLVLQGFNFDFLLFQVLVEYDGVDWQRREWVSVYSRRTFRVFLVERSLIWAPRVNEGKEVKWPALVSYFDYRRYM